MAATRRWIVGVSVTGLLAWRVAAASFHIEAGELTLTLNEWSRQSDVQVLFDFNLTRNHSSLPVICECTNEEALDLLLMGTDMVFDFVNERTVAVTPDPRWSTPASPEEFAAWMRRFEPVAQTYAEGQGPQLPPLILVLPAAPVLASR